MEPSQDSRVDTLSKKLIDHALRLGAEYAAILYQEEDSGSITVENGELRMFEDGGASGLGVRVLIDGALGIASSTKLDAKGLKDSIEYAVKMAKASKESIERIELADARPLKVKVESPCRISPADFSDEDKLKLVLEANKEGLLKGIVSSVTRMGWSKERRLFESSEGARVETTIHMTGLSHFAVAGSEGRLESVSDSKSRCAGFEFLSDSDWPTFCGETAELALKALEAGAPRSGNYQVVADPELVGLIFHEAIGHASEGDLVAARESVLEGRFSQRVASPLVTIIDQGVVDGGYYVPYDDEGVEKGRQVVVKEGVLMGYLQSRSSAHQLNMAVTGNARSQGFGDKPLVRQTNYFIEAGDATLEELLEDIDYGFYLCGRGAKGGEVDVGQGAFTFSAGPSYAVRKGELAEMVRGASIGGMVLETLNQVSGVGKDSLIETSFFGGCGKNGQRARVGHGGPHVRVEKMAVGGGGQ
jgi:TldD protein